MTTPRPASSNNSSSLDNLSTLLKTLQENGLTIVPASQPTTKEKYSMHDFAPEPPYFIGEPGDLPVDEWRVMMRLKLRALEAVSGTDDHFKVNYMLSRLKGRALRKVMAKFLLPWNQCGFRTAGEALEYTCDKLRDLVERRSVSGSGVGDA